MKRLFDFAAMVDPALSHELDFNNKRVTFFGLGATWDTGDYFAQTEYTMVHWGLGKKSIAPDEDAFTSWRANASATSAHTPFMPRKAREPLGS